MGVSLDIELQDRDPQHFSVGDGISIIYFEDSDFDPSLNEGDASLLEFTYEVIAFPSGINIAQLIYLQEQDGMKRLFFGPITDAA